MSAELLEKARRVPQKGQREIGTFAYCKSDSKRMLTRRKTRVSLIRVEEGKSGRRKDSLVVRPSEAKPIRKTTPLTHLLTMCRPYVARPPAIPIRATVALESANSKGHFQPGFRPAGPV